MTEANAPIDIGPEQIKNHKEAIEDKLLTNYYFRSGTHSLPDLLCEMDPDEKYIIGDIERDTYVALREGLQIFKEVHGQLGKKIGLNTYLVSVPSDRLGNDPKLARMQSFCNNYGAYVASTYVTHRLEEILNKAGYVNGGELEGLEMLRLETSLSATEVMRQMLAPAFADLLDHQADDAEPFNNPTEFIDGVKKIFARYKDITLERANVDAELGEHLKGYVWRVMDGYVELEGYKEITTPKIQAIKEEVSFQPVHPNDVVGNRSAKRKITRYIDRLALYDVNEQMNPILTLGGLSWTNLFDGLPGTGKTTLFRMAMTMLKQRAEQTGLPWHVYTVDQSIKDKYYGDTGQKLLARLAIANDPSVLAMGILDDIDLLTSNRDDAQGADNDINNILMQFLDGAFTQRRGNVINFAASNKPTGLDDALRNRFSDRLLIDGPNTAEDFADMTHILAKKLIKKGLIKIDYGYEPFLTQDQKGEHGWTQEDVSAYMADELMKYKKATILDFGAFMAGLKAKNPKITGRSSKAIIEAIKERTADFDVPEEWFEDRALFLDRPYAEKEQILSELYQPITPDVLFQEGMRYFDSEQRFATTEAEGAITHGYNNMKWAIESEIRALEDDETKENLQKLAILRTSKAVMEDRARQTILDAVRKAEEEAAKARK